MERWVSLEDYRSVRLKYDRLEAKLKSIKSALESTKSQVLSTMIDNVGHIQEMYACLRVDFLMRDLNQYGKKEVLRLELSIKELRQNEVFLLSYLDRLNAILGPMLLMSDDDYFYWELHFCWPWWLWFYIFDSEYGSMELIGFFNDNVIRVWLNMTTNIYFLLIKMTFMFYLVVWVVVISIVWTYRKKNREKKKQENMRIKPKTLPYIAV